MNTTKLKISDKVTMRVNAAWLGTVIDVNEWRMVTVRWDYRNGERVHAECVGFYDAGDLKLAEVSQS